MKKLTVDEICVGSLLLAVVSCGPKSVPPTRNVGPLEVAEQTDGKDATGRGSNAAQPRTTGTERSGTLDTDLEAIRATFGERWSDFLRQFLARYGARDLASLGELFREDAPAVLISTPGAVPEARVYGSTAELLAFVGESREWAKHEILEDFRIRRVEIAGDPRSRRCKADAAFGAVEGASDLFEEVEGVRPVHVPETERSAVRELSRAVDHAFRDCTVGGRLMYFSEGQGGCVRLTGMAIIDSTQ